VESCSGPTPTARLAGRVAARLALLPGLRASGADVVVVDGCASACASRRLEGRGARTAAIQLQELGVAADADPAAVDVDDVAARAVKRLRARALPHRTPRRSRRPRPPHVSSPDGRRSHSSRDYLLALYTLTTPVVRCGARATDLPTLSAHVARTLGVSRASAGEMVDRLEADGLIEHGPRKEILFTDEGQEAVADVVRRHRLAERLLTDTFGYTAAESYGLALQIREGCDDTLIEHIAARVSAPARCPHGWPIDVAEERRQLAEVVALSALFPGEEADVVALVEDDAPTLVQLAALGIVPDVAVRVLDSAGHGLTVAVSGKRRELSRTEAAAVFVRSSLR
jgi:DtxR family transcriptional regulator, Mn-dependent transcriptional regulator